MSAAKEARDREFFARASKPKVPVTGLEILQDQIKGYQARIAKAYKYIKLHRLELKIARSEVEYLRSLCDESGIEYEKQFFN